MSIPASDTLEFYKLLPRFKSLEMEQEFRASFLQQDKSFAKLIIFATILVSLASIIPDTFSGSPSESLRTLYLATIFYCCFSFIVLKALSSVRRHRIFDLMTTVWWGVVIIVAAISVTLYPPDMSMHVVFDILFPAAIYLLVPIGLISQFSLASLFTITHLTLLLIIKNNLTETDLAFITMAYAAVHLLGLTSCWQIHVGRRKQFIEKKSEQLLRGELQQAFDELQILRGIIPICCYCKQIRDDEGYWHRVEQYIENHSEAEFTHGICPDCIKEHYPREHEKLQQEL